MSVQSGIVVKGDLTERVGGLCTAGQSGGWASGAGSTPCSFRATGTVRDASSRMRYRVCGTHLRAALRAGAVRAEG